MSVYGHSLGESTFFEFTFLTSQLFEHAQSSQRIESHVGRVPYGGVFASFPRQLFRLFDKSLVLGVFVSRALRNVVPEYNVFDLVAVVSVGFINLVRKVSHIKSG